MRKPSRLEEKLGKLASVARELPSKSAREELTKALHAADNIVIARAARLIASSGDKGLCPALVGAFTRLLEMPPAADKSCKAKGAIVKALGDLDYQETEPFARGISHTQMEHVWGYDGPVDTAADLRAACIVMLANRYYPDIYFATVSLLLDPYTAPRLAAIGVLSSLGTEASELLLRVRALVHEEDPPVMHRCLSGLLSCNVERSWDFVAGFLRSESAVLAESAAIAIAESHNERAFQALRAAWEHNPAPEVNRTLLLAIALTRSDEAIEYLLSIISDGRPHDAALALQAMSIYAADEALRSRALGASASRREVEITEACRTAFGE